MTIILKNHTPIQLRLCRSQRPSSRHLTVVEPSELLPWSTKPSSHLNMKVELYVVSDGRSVVFSPPIPDGLPQSITEMWYRRLTSNSYEIYIYTKFHCGKFGLRMFGHNIYGEPVHQQLE